MEITAPPMVPPRAGGRWLQTVWLAQPRRPPDLPGGRPHRATRCSGRALPSAGSILRRRCRCSRPRASSGAMWSSRTRRDTLSTPARTAASWIRTSEQLRAVGNHPGAPRRHVPPTAPSRFSKARVCSGEPICSCGCCSSTAPDGRSARRAVPMTSSAPSIDRAACRRLQPDGSCGTIILTNIPPGGIGT